MTLTASLPYSLNIGPIRRMENMLIKLRGKTGYSKREK